MTLDASFIIPTYNKKEFLELTLTSLRNQTYPSDKFEVIIIDDGSTDGTDKLFSDIFIHPPFRLAYIKQENAGRSVARNTGLAQAQGETIVFIDDDQIVPPKFLESHMRLHQHNRKLVVSGYRSHVFSFVPIDVERQAVLSYLRNAFKIEDGISAIKPGDPLITADDICRNFNKVVSLSYGIDTDFERISKRYRDNLKSFFIPWIFFVTSNVSVGRNHLLEVGGFDENFTGWGVEDYELGYRLHKYGIQYTLERDAISYHQFHPRNFIESRESELKNYQYFCEKYPDVAIFLYWRKTYDNMSIHTYNSIVGEVAQLTETSPDSQLLADYKVLLKSHLETSGFDLGLWQEYWQLPTLAEKALQEKKYEEAIAFALKYINLNEVRADEQQAILQELPTPAEYGSYSHLNNVTRCWLVLARAYAARGENQKMLWAKCQIEEKYTFAQYWDVKKGFIKGADIASYLVKTEN